MCMFTKVQMQKTPTSRGKIQVYTTNTYQTVRDISYGTLSILTVLRPDGRVLHSSFTETSAIFRVPSLVTIF